MVETGKDHQDEPQIVLQIVNALPELHVNLLQVPCLSSLAE